MSAKPLAQLVDREALDRAGGRRGVWVLELPAAWLRDGATVEAVAPLRVACARCEGGGCEACGLRGGYRLPEATGARTVRFALPRAESERVRVRLASPFGEGDLEQLWVELRAGEAAPAGCRRIVTRRRGPLDVALIAVLLGLVVWILVRVLRG